MSQQYPGAQHPQQPRGPGVRSAATGHTYPAAARPAGFGPSPAQYGTMNATYAPPPNSTAGLEQVWSAGQRQSNRFLFNVIAYTTGGTMMLILIGIIMFQTGASATLSAALLSLVPLTIVLAGVMWLDRWEPEPKSMLLVALLWGAGVATLTSFWVNTAIVQAIFEQTGDVIQADTLGAVLVAPVVEEITKGVGVLAIFLLRRDYFDGPIDGVVYAATVAAGFAFTENILYLARDPDLVWVVFVMRGIISPFAHVLFTACIGIALGIAAKSRKRLAVLVAFPAGLVGAMGLHALWNGSAMLADNFLLLYLVVQVPLFLATVVLLAWLRRQEADVIRARLGEYAQVGWFAPHEVQMLSSLRMRAQARQWAGTYDGAAGEAMKKFQRHATELAFLRQRTVTGRNHPQRNRSEHELLNSLAQVRHAFHLRATGAPAPAAPPGPHGPGPHGPGSYGPGSYGAGPHSAGPAGPH